MSKKVKYIVCQIKPIALYFLVASVLFGHQGDAKVAHAMVLDAMVIDADNDMLIFKNTYDQQGQPKKVRIGRTHPNAPKELYFVHIDIKDMNNLPSQEERAALMEERIDDLINNGTY